MIPSAYALRGNESNQPRSIDHSELFSYREQGGTLEAHKLLALLKIGRCLFPHTDRSRPSSQTSLLHGRKATADGRPARLPFKLDTFEGPTTKQNAPTLPAH